MRKHRHNIVSAILLALVCIILAFSNVLHASAPQGQKLLNTIQSMDGIWYQGSIDAISKHAVTIGDVNHYFEEGALFVTHDGALVSRHFFSQGKEVKILINRDRRCVVVLEL